MKPMSSHSLLLGCLLSLALVACGGKNNPATPDAEVPAANPGSAKTPVVRCAP